MKTPKTKLALITFIALAVLLTPAFFVLAQELEEYVRPDEWGPIEGEQGPGPDVIWDVSPVNTGTKCFDYYRFGSVEVHLDTMKEEYVAGQTAKFHGQIVNKNNYPVVDGNVFVRIGRKNDNYFEEGNFIVDELLALENVNLDTNETKDVEFKWSVPSGLTNGEYQADFFFSVGKKFNLGGLPFSNEIRAGFNDFSISADNASFVSFDRSGTKVNEKKYQHIGIWPNIKSGEKAEIIQPIESTYSTEKKVKVSYDLYFWDSLNESDKISSKEETITIPANSSATLSYVIPQVSEAIYYLRITAETEEGQKSIVNVRISSNQERLRINYPAINKFPIKEGEKFTLFSCFHGTSGANLEGKIDVLLTDKENKKVGEMSYQGQITSAMAADKSDITAAKDLNYLNLVAKIYDKDGKIVDQYETVYDCNFFDNCIVKTESQESVTSSKYSTFNILIIAGVIIFLSTLIYMVIKNRRNKSNISTLIILFSLLFCGVLLFSGNANAFNQKAPATDELYSAVTGTCECANCGGGDTCYHTSHSFCVNSLGCYKRNTGGRVEVLHAIEPDQLIEGSGVSVATGTTINFSYDPVISYEDLGGDWDTPFGEWCPNNSECFTTCESLGCDGSAGSCDAFKGTNCGDLNLMKGDTTTTGTYMGAKWDTWTGDKPETASSAADIAGKVYITSSNPAAVTCNGMNCTTNFLASDVILTAHFPETEVKYWQWFAGFGHARPARYFGNYDYDYLVRGRADFNCSTPPSSVKQNVDVTLPSTSAQWVVDVKNPFSCQDDANIDIANADPCTGDDTGLTENVTETLVATAGDCSDPANTTKCEYHCKDDYFLYTDTNTGITSCERSTINLTVNDDDGATPPIEGSVSDGTTTCDYLADVPQSPCSFYYPPKTQGISLTASEDNDATLFDPGWSGSIPAACTTDATNLICSDIDMGGPGDVKDISANFRTCDTAWDYPATCDHVEPCGSDTICVTLPEKVTCNVTNDCGDFDTLGYQDCINGGVTGCKPLAIECPCERNVREIQP